MAHAALGLVCISASLIWSSPRSCTLWLVVALLTIVPRFPVQTASTWLGTLLSIVLAYVGPSPCSAFVKAGYALEGALVVGHSSRLPFL